MKRTGFHRERLLVGILLGFFSWTGALAQETQWSGVNRDGKYMDTGLLQSWPEDGPRLILEKEGDSPNRYQISKQADVLMLFYLFSADELALIFDRLGYKFNPETIPANIQYYLQRSSHGSTLSHVVDAWVLARSDRAASWQLFQEALRSDIHDIQDGTTGEGIHLGAMAGSVDLLHRCYTGMETRGYVLHFNPMLPDELSRLKISLHYRGHRLTVEITHEMLKVCSQPQLADPITIAYRGHYRDLASGQSFEIRLLKPRESS